MAQAMWPQIISKILPIMNFHSLVVTTLQSMIPTSLVTTPSGKSVMQHKPSVCQFFSDPHRNSTLWLDQIHTFSHYNKPSNHSFQYSEDGKLEPLTCLEYLTVLLVCSKELIWLTVVQIYRIKQNGIFIDYIPTHLIIEQTSNFNSKSPYWRQGQIQMRKETGSGLEALKRGQSK